MLQCPDPRNAFAQVRTKCGKGPDCVGMVLSIEVQNFGSRFGPHGVQKRIAWVVHHLGQRPQRIGNVACSEVLCIGHCSNTDIQSSPMML